MERYKEYLETKYSPLLEKRFKDLKKKKLSASKMNKREVKSYYKEMNSPSLDFLRSTNNQLRLYVDWLINEKNDKIRNVYKTITFEDLKQCIIHLDTRIISRKDLLIQIQSLPNASDKFFCLALFEGIRGNHYRDMHYIKREDINEKDCTITLQSGEVRKVSKELIEYGIESCEATQYYSFTDARDYQYKNPTSGYIFKAQYNSKISDGELNLPDTTLLSKYKYISMRIRSTMNQSEAYMPKALRDSGMIDMIKRLYKQDKKKYKDTATIKNTILTHKKEIEDIYGIMYSAEKFILRYENQFDK